MDLDSDSDGEEVCPLCCNELDATDLNFLPCPCGYQVCLYCYGRLESEFQSRCPACRNVYEEGSYKITNPADLAKYVKNYTKELKQRKAMREKRRTDRKRRKAQEAAETKRQQQRLFASMQNGSNGGGGGRDRTNSSDSTGVPDPAPLTPQQRKELIDTRVIQRNLGKEKKYFCFLTDHPGHPDKFSIYYYSPFVSFLLPFDRHLTLNHCLYNIVYFFVVFFSFFKVYVIGLAPKIAKEEMLRSHEYFGQYGTIIKVVVNRSHIKKQNTHNSASAYITYERQDAARESIAAIHGFVFDDRTIKCSFGTF